MYVINFLSLKVNGKIAFDMLYDGVLCYSFKSETNLGQSYRYEDISAKCKMD